MSLEKTLARTNVLQEMGIKADDQLDAYKAELKEMDGVLRGLLRAQTVTEGMLVRVDREIDGGKLDLAQGKLVKDWIVQSVNEIKGQHQLMTQANYMVRGRIEATQRHVEMIKRFYDVEKAKLQQYASTPEEQAENVIPINGGESRRPVSLKTRRIQESNVAPVDPPPTPKKKRKPKKVDMTPPTPEQPA